jgi:hypothetical protein
MEVVWRLADTLRRRRTQTVHAAPSPGGQGLRTGQDRADANDEDDGGYNELHYNKIHYILCHYHLSSMYMYILS